MMRKYMNNTILLPSLLVLCNTKQYIEIIFVIALFYRYLTFLYAYKQMKTYAQCAFLIIGSAITWHIELPTITAIFLLYALIIIATSLVEYYVQHTKKPLYTRTMHKTHMLNYHDWISTLMQSISHVPHQKTPLACVIEQQQLLEPYIDNHCVIQALINKELCELLIHSEKLRAGHTLLIKHTGIIQGIHTSLQNTNTAYNHDHIYEILLHDYCMLTQKTDALVFIRTAHNNNITIIHQGTYTNNVTIIDTIRLLKKICFTGSKESIIHHEMVSKKNTQLQP
jgi:hypothetical protein